MELFVQRLFDAAANGAVYAALAVALALVYRSSGVMNFALGELAMAGTVIALVLASKPSPLLPGSQWAGKHLHTPWSIWIVIPTAMAITGILGALTERLLVRRAERRSPMAVVSVTLGVGLMLNGGAAQLLGARFFAFPTPIPRGPSARWRIAGANLWFETVWTIAALAGVLLLLAVLQRRTKLGLAFRAVASNRAGAELVGVPVNTVLALGWGIAGALGALAGILVANNVFVSTTMMTRLLVFAFAAVAVGGLSSPGGAALGGLLLALFETMLGGYIPFVGNDLALVAAIAVLVVVLLFRPSGLFGRRTPLRV